MGSEMCIRDSHNVTKGDKNSYGAVIFLEVFGVFLKHWRYLTTLPTSREAVAEIEELKRMHRGLAKMLMESFTSLEGISS